MSHRPGAEEARVRRGDRALPRAVDRALAHVQLDVANEIGRGRADAVRLHPDHSGCEARERVIGVVTLRVVGAAFGGHVQERIRHAERGQHVAFDERGEVAAETVRRDEAQRADAGIAVRALRAGRELGLPACEPLQQLRVVVYFVRHLQRQAAGRVCGEMLHSHVAECRALQ